MKILLNNMNSTLKSSANYMQPKSVDIKGKDQRQNCDTITISSSGASAMPDNQFISLLKSHLSSEVKAGASSYKLSDLTNQVELKQYEINPLDIAKKIMLDNGEV